MDETDFRIISILKRNSRKSFTSVARELGVTEGTARNRISRLAREGSIKFTIGYRAPVEGLVIAKTLKNNKEIISRLKGFSENIFEISGEHDVALILEAHSIKELNRKVDAIRVLRGVLSTITAIKLN